MFYVDVAINLPINGMYKEFTYGVSEKLSCLDIGWRVVVPFQSQTVEGFVVGKKQQILDRTLLSKLKMVTAVIGTEPWFDAEMLATAQWLSKYYMCTLAEAMRIFVPGKCSIKRKAIKDGNGQLIRYEYKERLQEKLALAYQLTEQGYQALGIKPEDQLSLKLECLAESLKRKPSRLQLLIMLELIKAGEALSLPELVERGISADILKSLIDIHLIEENEAAILIKRKIGQSTLNTLLDKGFLERIEKRILRNSYAKLKENGQYFILTKEQELAVSSISEGIELKQGTTYLLQGITGSGKTEVYLRSAAKAVSEGKQVLMLVPEIALTAQLVKRFQAWFGNQIAVAHSKLSQNERGDVWYKMRTGEARVLIGVRSAVFAPFDNLGLIIIDEEHESSYKQDERPGYHAREVALQRSRFTGAPLVLGSATPDLGSYYHALKGEYVHLKLTQRPTGSALPQVKIVDMRKELAERNFSVLSRALQQELVQVAAKGEQSIILLNRRGYSTFVMCRDCGETIKCQHCAVAMVYHTAKDAFNRYNNIERLRCHYCGNEQAVPKLCPNCKSKRIKFFGTGTQKAEAELMQLPEVRVLRMDQDSTAAKFAHFEILERFSSGEYNTLIGTQMVAKGHDIPNVTLVGVLAADSSLNLPDYRASERTFSLLTQAAGRAGRGEKSGRVIMQAYEADSKILELAAKQDYDTFAHGELKARDLLFYPPFSRLLKLTVLDKNKASAENLAEELVDFLQSKVDAGELKATMILGPFAALAEKVRDLYRINCMVKAQDMEPVKEILMNSKFRGLGNIYFDVDPMNVL